MVVFENEITDYFSVFEKVIRITDSENVLFKRITDGTVVISHEDHITGTLTRLGYYRSGKWVGHNACSLQKMFVLFRKHKNLKPALFRFLTPDTKLPFKIEKYVTCARKRFHISLKKVAKAVHLP